VPNIESRCNQLKLGHPPRALARASTLMNASAESQARFREYVKAGRVLCARSIQPLNVAAQFAADAGPMEIQ
jgi:hypothetical protein